MNGDYAKRVALAELPIEEVLAKGVFCKILASAYFSMPKTLDYYRYLSSEKLRGCLKTYGSWVREYVNEIRELTEAKEICLGFEDDETFRRTLKIFPWVASAYRDSVESAEYRRNDIMHSFCIRQDATRAEYVKNISSYITELRMCCGFLVKFIRAIWQMVGVSPAPMPLPDVILPKVKYPAGGVLIGFEQVNLRTICSCEPGPFKAFVSLGKFNMDETQVRALTPEELIQYGLEELADQPDLDPNYRLPDKNLKHWLAVPMETYKFYRDHPDAIDEHIRILDRAFDSYSYYLIVENLKTMKKNFQALMSQE